MGELVIEIDGRLAFDALQMRVHPAESRIRKLSTETPACLIVFDLLAAPDGPVVIDRPFRQRRHRLETFMAEVAIPKRFVISPATSDLASAQAWLREAGLHACPGRYSIQSPAQSQIPRSASRRKARQRCHRRNHAKAGRHRKRPTPR